MLQKAGTERSSALVKVETDSFSDHCRLTAVIPNTCSGSSLAKESGVTWDDRVGGTPCSQAANK